MSHRHTDAIWKHSRQQGTALLVLLALAWYADETGRAWPRTVSLAHRVRLSLRQLRRILRRLEAAREVSIEPLEGDHRRHAYRLLVQPTSSRADNPRRKAPPPLPGGPLAATGLREPPPPFDQGARLERLADALPADLPAAAAWRRRILALSGPLAEVEERLLALDAQLLRDAEGALHPEDARRLRREVADTVDTLMRNATVRLPASEAPRQRQRLHAEKLRSYWDLPQLSLFSATAEGLAPNPGPREPR